MSLVINRNIMAANAATELNRHYGRLGTSIQRLSTGLRINSAADDAAGLTIRELMRADIAALNQGVRNTNDAISMLQVADGALGIIDEKLIRMKELAEQAATGTYDSTQRLMIDSEYKAMAAEIDRIAAATDFNGIKLLNGSLSGTHNGSGLNAKGAVKIHFGSANDSAEDYYYIKIGDCSTKGLGLREAKKQPDPADPPAAQPPAQPAIDYPTIDDATVALDTIRMPVAVLGQMQTQFNGQGIWSFGADSNGNTTNNFMFIIPAGSRNVLINASGGETSVTPIQQKADNDIQVFTRTGVHLAGTPLDDFVYNCANFGGSFVNESTSLADNAAKMGFQAAAYDGSVLNSGPAVYQPGTLAYSTYNGMTIGYTGDPDRSDNDPNDGNMSVNPDYETLTIDVVTEDLVVWLAGAAGGPIKAYWDLPDEVIGPPLKLNADAPPTAQTPVQDEETEIVSIDTQEKAQNALVTIKDAIVKKDRERANIGALQNRLENTAASLMIQAENLRGAESRISDADVALEMGQFVRNQILAQSAVAMLGQANSMPQMAMRLIGG